MKSSYFPLGELVEDRVNMSKRYSLLELVNGVYRLTDKCRSNYNEIDYLKYLKGLIDQQEIKRSPIEEEPVQKQPPEKIVKADPEEYKNPECQKLINEILGL